MFAVTYEAEELSLLPDVPNCLTQFYGEIDLDALPGGPWKVEAIRALTTDYAVRPIASEHVEIAPHHPLYELVVKALEAHDRKTQAVTLQVCEKLEGAYAAAARDRVRDMREVA